MRAPCVVALSILSFAPVIASTENDYEHLRAVGLLDWGGGEKVFAEVPHLTDEQRKAIQKMIDGNIRMLRSPGRLETALVP